MKTLQLNQIESINGGDGWGLGFFCTLAVIGSAVAITTTAGLATVVVAAAVGMGGGLGCGWNIGDTILNGL